jgi:hypothetical protein
LIWLISAGIIQQNAIHPTEIVDRGISLTRVARPFRDALYAERDRREALAFGGLPYEPQQQPFRRYDGEDDQAIWERDRR